MWEPPPSALQAASAKMNCSQAQLQAQFLCAYEKDRNFLYSRCWSGGHPGWIPGSGRSAGEGIGYPLQYSWVSLVTH